MGSDRERLEMRGGNGFMSGAMDGGGNGDDSGLATGSSNEVGTGAGNGAGIGAGIGVGTFTENYQRDVVSHTHRPEPVPDLRALPFPFFCPGFLSFGGTTPSMYH